MNNDVWQKMMYDKKNDVWHENDVRHEQWCMTWKMMYDMNNNVWHET